MTSVKMNILLKGMPRGGVRGGYALNARSRIGKIGQIGPKYRSQTGQIGQNW